MGATHASVQVVDVVRTSLVTVQSDESVGCLVRRVDRLERKIEEKWVSLCRRGVNVKEPLGFLSKDHGRVVLLTGSLWRVRAIARVAVYLAKFSDQNETGRSLRGARRVLRHEIDADTYKRNTKSERSGI